MLLVSGDVNRLNLPDEEKRVAKAAPGTRGLMQKGTVRSFPDGSRKVWESQNHIATHS